MNSQIAQLRKHFRTFQFAGVVVPMFIWWREFYLIDVKSMLKTMAARNKQWFERPMM